MEEEKSLVVNGFKFGAAEDVKIAEQEISAIKYLERQLENRGGETMLAVYQATLEKRLFRTPIGYSYLYDLQRRMMRMGIDRSRIPDIPLYQIYNEEYKKKERVVKTTVSKPKTDFTKKKLRNSIIINVVLVLLIIVFFFITLTANQPNIINYRNRIQNEYSEWEQELKEREQTVRQKEKELKISYED